MDDYEKKYKEALERAKAINEGKTTGKMGETVCEYIFPELKESEDEKIRKEIRHYLEVRRCQTNDDDEYISCNRFLAWLEKQGEQSIRNIPSRETILAIWDLGNEWKELTHGNISTKHGTQLDYIQKHWQESEYYLREKQVEQKPADKVKPKFKAGDWVQIKRGNVLYIKDVHETYYETVNWIGLSNTRVISDIDSISHLWTIQDAKDGDVLVHNNCTFIFVGIKDGIVQALTEGFYIEPACFGEPDVDKDYHPATKEQRDQLEKAMTDAGYKWNKEQLKLEKIETIEDPNFFDDFRKSDSEEEHKPADKVEPKFKADDWVVRNKANFVFRVVSVGPNGYEVVNRENYKKTISFDNESNYHLWTIQDAKDGDVLAFYSEYRGNKTVQIAIIEKYVGKHGGCSNTFKIYVGVNWDNNLQIGEYMGCPDIRPATKEQRDTFFAKMKESGYEWDAEKKELKKIEQKYAKWSKDDEEMLNDAIGAVGAADYYAYDYKQEIENRLKSLKNRYTWKPSDEQIEALDSATENCAYSEYQDCLKELLKQLKKLREG